MAKQIDLNLLPALEALLDERHVTRAGDRLNVTQSAMSGILRRLRAYFDDELLVRSGNQLLLTPLAETLIPLVREAQRSTDRLFGAVEFAAETSTRRFTISASDYAQAVLAPRLGELLGAAAGVRVDFVPHPVDLLREPQNALLKHDLIIIPSTFLPAYEPTSERVFEDQFVCVVAAGHPLIESGAPTLEALATAPLVTSSFGLSQQVGLALGGVELVKEGRTFRGASMEVSSILAVPDIIRRGVHWSLMPRRLAEMACRDDDLRIFDAPFPTETFTDAMYWHASRSHDPALLWLRGIVRSVAESAS